MDFLTIGDAVFDTILFPEKSDLVSHKKYDGALLCLYSGSKISIKDFSESCGGSATNVAIGLKRAGFSVALISAVGQDSAGEKIISILENEGIETQYLKIEPGMKTSFSSVINVEGERTILTHHGILDYSILTPPTEKITDWVYLGPIRKGYERVFETLIKLAQTKLIRIAWNPGNLQIEKGARYFKKILDASSVIFLNREESIEFVNIPGIAGQRDILRTLNNFGPEVVVITDGPEGAWAFNSETYFRIPALESKVVDATGAGDAFAAGFLTGLITARTKTKKKKPSRLELLIRGPEKVSFDSHKMETALKYGIINATSVINQSGAQKGLLSLFQLRSKAKNKNLKIKTNF